MPFDNLSRLKKIARPLDKIARICYTLCMVYINQNAAAKAQTCRSPLGGLPAGKCCTVCGQQQIAAVTALLQVDGEAERQVYLALPQNKCPALYELIIDV